jgi:hypothetical protein
LCVQQTDIGWIVKPHAILKLGNLVHVRSINYCQISQNDDFTFKPGYTFPTLKEADAMFMAEKAPEWKEGDACARCRTRFGTFNRQVMELCQNLDIKS